MKSNVIKKSHNKISYKYSWTTKKVSFNFSEMYSLQDALVLGVVRGEMYCVQSIFAQYLSLVSCMIHYINVWYPWYTTILHANLLKMYNIYAQYIRDPQQLCMVSMIRNIHAIYTWYKIFIFGIRDTLYLVVSLILCILDLIQLNFPLSKKCRNLNISFLVSVTSWNWWPRPLIPAR